jgi:hypothetical protein
VLKAKLGFQDIGFHRGYLKLDVLYQAMAWFVLLFGILLVFGRRLTRIYDIKGLQHICTLGLNHFWRSFEMSPNRRSFWRIARDGYIPVVLDILIPNYEVIVCVKFKCIC